MNLKLLSPLICLLLLLSYRSYADKSYLYAYDANGNRTNVSYISNCRIRDTLQLDTIPIEILKELKEVTSPSIYPNPMREYFTLSFPSLSKVTTLEIYDMNGSLVYKDLQINTIHTIINSCNLASGMYTVVVYNGDEKPFVIKIEKL